jgi:hypothetical protein
MSQTEHDLHLRKPVWTGRENYRGYTIAEANRRGGKAGRNKNRTSTIQVRQALSSGYLLKGQFRYTVGSRDEQIVAVEKARQRIDSFFKPT